jgi:hypothetical protein
MDGLAFGSGFLAQRLMGRLNAPNAHRCKVGKNQQFGKECKGFYF